MYVDDQFAITGNAAERHVLAAVLEQALEDAEGVAAGLWEAQGQADLMASQLPVPTYGDEKPLIVFLELLLSELR